jgi:CO/xanthine dehydrogenase Mo-binding subunit
VNVARFARDDAIAVSRRDFLKGGGALVIALGAPAALAQRLAAIGGAPGKTLDAGELDGFLAVHRDGSVTLYSGKVDLGQGLRIAIPQMAAEELGIDVARITLVEGDTALTPDQGPTAGSSGVMRGGVQIREAAATAREALIAMAAERLGVPASELAAVNGEVRPNSGGRAIGFGELVGDRRFGLKIDKKAPLRRPAAYTVVGKPLPRPDVPAKVTGTHAFVHDVRVPGMLHARVVRPASVGAGVVSVDESSIRSIPAARVVRIADFVAVVAPDEWDAIVASRRLAIAWSASRALIGDERVQPWMRAGPFESEQSLTKKGDAQAALAAAGERLSASYYWPLQTHGSMGPSCAVADVRDGRATIWTASQATHRFRPAFARILGLPVEAVRLIYVDGAGCYGMNGHDDAAADAALLSKATGKPVRVQWMREDEHGWDPKGPPQMLSLDGALAADGTIAAWRTEMWLPKATASLPHVPLLGPQDAGIAQPQGISTGLISQNGDPPYAVPNVDVLVHWLKDSPLRPSNIRAPGKIANVFAVESFTDELAAKAGVDPVEFRLRGLADPRGIEVVRRAAALAGWRPRATRSGSGSGRGFAYAHYKHNETYVAMAMDVDVDRASGAIRVRRVACAHDCGLVINPDALQSQIEGNILQTLSRTLHEEVKFDAARVTSVDWKSYPILTYPEVPEIAIDLVVRPDEPPLGAGEASTVTVPGALANAVYDAVGVRLRTVPFTRERVKGALAA